MEPFLLDKLRDPVALLVVLQELGNEVLHSNEPAWDCLVDEGSLRAPAEGVGVGTGALMDQTTFLFESLHYVFVGRLYGGREKEGGKGREEGRTEEEKSKPIDFIFPRFVTFTYSPLKSTTSSVNFPEASTGHTTCSPFLTIPNFLHTRKSSSPNPGAWWTTPVPLSAVT